MLPGLHRLAFHLNGDSHAAAQPRLKAGARYDRRLEGVGCQGQEVAPAKPDLIIPCETAEAHGFEVAWLFDPPIIYSEAYVIMSLVDSSEGGVPGES
jgi:hypothetical protein